MFTKVGQYVLCVHKSGTLSSILGDLEFVICDNLLFMVCNDVAGREMQCVVSGLKVGIYAFKMVGWGDFW